MNNIDVMSMDRALRAWRLISKLGILLACFDVSGGDPKAIPIP
jgi:hypothetical protein